MCVFMEQKIITDNDDWPTWNQDKYECKRMNEWVWTPNQRN